MRKVVARYWAFKEEVKYKIVLPHGNAVTLNEKAIIFHIPMPTGWSEEKRKVHRGQAHMTTPDKDNLEKGLMDAMYINDSGIYDSRTIKLWADEGAIEIVAIEPWI